MRLRPAVIALVLGVGSTVLALPTHADPTLAPPTAGPCRYTPTPDDPAARPIALPPDPTPTPTTGIGVVDLETNRGRITVVLDRNIAPCTVQNFLHLAKSGYFNKTVCHRLTKYDRLQVLQCGDPLGTGWGGPGYSFKDELPTTLKPWPTDPTGARKIYPKGVVAMANAGPDTNGSQFFIVNEDSGLRPNYTIFGHVFSQSSWYPLDQVAKAGVDPQAENAPLDGRPALSIEIKKVNVHLG